jgi:hypothetical protein
MMLTIMAASLTLHTQHALAATPVPRQTDTAITPVVTAAPKNTLVATALPTNMRVTHTATTAIPAGTALVTRTAAPVPVTVTPASVVPSLTGTPTPRAHSTGTTVTPTTATTPTPLFSPDSRPGTPVRTVTLPPMRIASPPALPSPTASPAAIRVTSIMPPSVRNDHDMALSISGAEFVKGMTLAIGGKPLTNVTVTSSTALAATLPAGLCPSAYSVTLKDEAGRTMPGGGQVRVEGVRTATLGAWAANPAIGVARQAQTFTLELPIVEIVDTTCGTDDWQLTMTLGAFSPFEDGHGALPLHALRLSGATSSRSGDAPLAVKAGETSGRLSVPRAAGQTSVSIRPLIGVDVPSHGYAGQYRMSVAVSFAGDNPDEGTRQPGGQR